ncbi:MAG TPA: hypothetical protein VGF25_07565 [Thermoleophilaceae bacterium]|jgi:hypothetical protein
MAGIAPRRYALVPLPEEERPVPGAARIRRFGLARVGVSPRSATGLDRHERLERAADPKQAPPGG